jgi:Xaa-Pro aminopeptidase
MVGLLTSISVTSHSISTCDRAEPGYYEDGKFGIRLENIVIVQPASPPNDFGEKGWLKFENVTMCPMHGKLIEKSLLSSDELAWVNAYHKEVMEKVGAMLDRKNEDDLRAKAWLEKECKPL